MTVAQDKTGVGAGSMEWQTPPELFAWLNRRFQFDYDAFASHENALCDSYSTMEGTYTKTLLFGGASASGASVSGPPQKSSSECRHIWKISGDDGIMNSWAGRRVWINPPYSRGLIEQCIEKAYNERNSAQIIVALIPASTETQWFQKYILPYCHLEFLPRRVRFIDPATGQPGQSPPSGSVVAIFKQDYQ